MKQIIKDDILFCEKHKTIHSKYGTCVGCRKEKRIMFISGEEIKERI